jgi:hypothetical protein
LTVITVAGWFAYYLQRWLRTKEIPEQSAKRIITNAHRVLAAGN